MGGIIVLGPNLGWSHGSGQYDMTLLGIARELQEEAPEFAASIAKRTTANAYYILDGSGWNPEEVRRFADAVHRYWMYRVDHPLNEEYPEVSSAHLRILEDLHGQALPGSKSWRIGRIGRAAEGDSGMTTPGGEGERGLSTRVEWKSRPMEGDP